MCPIGSLTSLWFALCLCRVRLDWSTPLHTSSFELVQTSRVSHLMEMSLGMRCRTGSRLGVGQSRAIITSSLPYIQCPVTEFHLPTQRHPAFFIHYFPG
ncbi:hypothetical protein JB92DRAFT_3099741 [Gautieria morchelliformis]|nr:hypothetical protein JB92DRAFT_3099741 [Gautieria morchelliformis]